MRFSFAVKEIGHLAAETASITIVLCAVASASHRQVSNARDKAVKPRQWQKSRSLNNPSKIRPATAFESSWGRHTVANGGDNTYPCGVHHTAIFRSNESFGVAPPDVRFAPGRK